MAYDADNDDYFDWTYYSLNIYQKFPTWSEFLIALWYKQVNLMTYIFPKAFFVSKMFLLINQLKSSSKTQTYNIEVLWKCVQNST